MNKYKIKLAFSPCPNDTFIFNALVNGHIDTEGIDFEVMLADVQELNQMAFHQTNDITKLSFNAYGLASPNYILLDSGSALGRGCGPLLINKTGVLPPKPEEALIAIPGINTTANLLLSICFPQLINKKEMLFSDIVEAVLTDKAQAGLIIHESRFTFGDKGLNKIADLGDLWEKQTGLPIPLGGIAAKRSLPTDIIQKVNRLISKSIQWAWEHPDSGQEFIARHANEMSASVIYQHIQLYVNEFSVNLGTDGKHAISSLLKAGESLAYYRLPELPLFASELE